MEHFRFHLKGKLHLFSSCGGDNNSNWSNSRQIVLTQLKGMLQQGLKVKKKLNNFSNFKSVVKKFCQSLGD